MSKKRILITGGNGFVGAHLTQRLIRDGNTVFLLTRPQSDKTRLSSVLDQVNFLTGDVTDTASIRRVVKDANPEVVYHLASTAFNPPTTSAQTHFSNITTGTLNLLEALVDRPGIRIIGTGSAAEYGGGSRLKESSPLFPGTVLGCAKAAATLFMQTYARLHGMETVVLRVFTPYGPWERPDRLIPHSILSALRGKDIEMSLGTQQRDYLYVDDLVEALILAATRSILGGTVLNICSGKGTPVIDIVRTALHLMGNPVKILAGARPTRPDEIHEISGDSSAAQKILGWQPRVKLEDGLQQTVDWFKNHQELAEKLK